MALHRKSFIGWSIVFAAIVSLTWAAANSTVEQKAIEDVPLTVDVSECRADGSVVRQFTVREQRFMHRVREMFPNFLRSDSSSQPPPQEHLRLEIIIPEAKHARMLYVWREGDVEYWGPNAQDKRETQGRFDLLVTMLPVQRTFEMILSVGAEDRATGNELMAKRSDEFFDIVLENCRRQTEYGRQDAVRLLWQLVEWHTPKAPRTTGGHPIYLKRRPFVAGPMSADHPKIAEVREEALRLFAEPKKLGDVTEILALVADEATIDALTMRLETVETWQERSALLICLQACLGLPTEPGSAGPCGISTPDEIEAFHRMEEARTKKEKQQRLLWLNDWKAVSPAERDDAAIAMWMPRMSQKPQDHERLFDGQVRRYGNLLRRGPEMIPAIERAQASTANLLQRGGLEFAKAYWTGRCDRELVEKLLQGNRQQKMLACNIIAAAEDSSWKDQLNNVLGEYVSGEPEAGYLEEKVIETLVICNGPDAVPLIEGSGALSRGNRVASQAIQHFEVPYGDR